MAHIERLLLSSTENNVIEGPQLLGKGAWVYEHSREMDCEDVRFAFLSRFRVHS